MELRQFGQVDDNVIMIEITPAQAQVLLDFQPTNRNIRKDFARSLARDILSGNWVPELSTIYLGPDGQLLDGQHRMRAVVIANVPVKTRVVLNADPAQVNRVMDSGKPRKLADRLNILGVANYQQCSAALKLMMQYKFKTTSVSLSPSEEMDVYHRHPLMGQSVFLTKRCQKLFSPSAVAVAHHLLVNTINHPLAIDFISTIIDNITPSATLRYGRDDPAARCREWMIHYASDCRSRKAIPSSFVLMKAVAYSWNAYVPGRTAKKFQSPVEREMDVMLGVNSDLI